jgi:hypothetical protein
VVGTQTAGQLLGNWVRWDADWYLNISRLGYFSDQATAFFPLYPLLIAALTAAGGEASRPVAAMLVANLFSLAAFVGVGLLAAHELGAASAARAVLVVAAYPLALFLAAPYTESLFLAFAVFTLLWARQGRWRLAAAAAFLGALTRPTGAILLLPLLVEFGRQHDWIEWLRAGRPRLRPSGRTLVDGVLAVGAVPLAFAGYMAFLWLQFGRPLLFLDVQRQYWVRMPLAPWDWFRAVFGQLVSDPTLGYWQALLVLNLGMLILFTALTMFGWKRLPLSFNLYMVALLYLCVATPNLSNLDPLSSVSRFLVVAVPAFLVLAVWLRGRPWLQTLVLGGGFMLQAVFLTLFLSGAWLA